MSSDCQIIVQGLVEEAAHRIGSAVSAVASVLAQTDEALDLRRMHRVIITADFAGQLSQLSSATASGNPISHTNEQYATAAAQVLLLPAGDGYEILPVVDAHLIAAFAAEDNADRISEDRQDAFHFLHHELCHVHDYNKQIDAFPNIMLHCRYEGKDRFIGPLAESCWSEYVANFLSSCSVSQDWLTAMTGSFVDAIPRTKRVVRHEIASYRYHADIDRLMREFERHGEFLVKAAAYTMGYMDGLGLSLSELPAKAAEQLSGSYFEPVWTAMHEALRMMRQLYPTGWSDRAIYRDLAAVLEDYYARMGLVLSNTEDGQAYVDVPF